MTASAAPHPPSPAAPAAPPRGPLLPSYPPHDYLGQLDPAFQAALSKRREGADLSDFVWYHAFELPDGTVLPGVWDLRGHESAYLGGVDLAGKRVLELGPATGYLTFYMERMGAEVVSFEAGFDVSIDTLPVKGEDQYRGAAARHAGDHRPQPRRLVVPAPHARAPRPSSSRGTSTTCRPISGPSTSRWSGPSCCTCASPGARSRRRRGGRPRP